MELGQSTPSIGSLQRICEALGVDLGELLSGHASPVLRRSRRDGMRSDWSKATAESLMPAGSDDRLSAMILRIDAAGRTGSTSYAAGSRVFAYLTAGDQLLLLDGAKGAPKEEIPLEEGDSLMLDGPRTLAWENRSEKTSELLLIVARLR